MADKQTLDHYRKQMQAYLGMPVTLRSRGRKQNQVHTGIVDGVYASVFTLVLDDASGARRISYTYCDLLTENISILPIA